MHLLFLRRSTPACLAIRLATWSRWSHVAAVFGQQAFEATARRGVRQTTVAEVLVGATDHAWASVPCRTEPALRFLEAQVGKPYDWTAIVGMLLRRDWQEDDSWFCSELVATASVVAGVPIIRKTQNRVTPEDVWTSVAVQRGA